MSTAKNGTRTPPRSHLDPSTVSRKLRAPESAQFHETFAFDGKNEARVLVLYTGGTIGMVRNDEGALSCLPHAMEQRIRQSITLHDDNYASERFSTCLDRDNNEVDIDKLSYQLPLVLPIIEDQKRILYTIFEYDPLLDSSNMTMDDWITIANDIKRYYPIYDGFVVLHGTDTLAYTASALSFMLEDLGKPIIVTGSQIPLFETRSDGRDNFVGALILAGNYCIPEVGVYFRHQLMRGNRTVKISSGDLDAFHSPNMNPLVKAGIDIEVDSKAIHRPKSIQKFRVHNRLNRNVVLLRLFPSIRTETIAHFLTPPIEGVILQCYGAGNMPSNRKDILEYFKAAAERGVIIVSVTQCVNGGVSGLYETGKALLDVGVIPGNDLTPEAALTKLSYVLSKDEWSIQEKRDAMMANLVGELTVLNMNEAKSCGLRDDDEGGANLELLKAIAEALNLNTSEELKHVEGMLFPSLLCAAAYKNDLHTLDTLGHLGADFAQADYDERSPLHVAASEGKVEIVRFLLENGAPVHARDRNDATPLQCAIDAGHQDVVDCLVSCGAHLQYAKEELGEILCQAARLGRVSQLECFGLAGADLSRGNLSAQTPLHAATEAGQVDAARFLISKGVELHAKNCYKQTPLDIATALGRPQILSFLETAISQKS